MVVVVVMTIVGAVGVVMVVVIVGVVMVMVIVGVVVIVVVVVIMTVVGEGEVGVVMVVDCRKYTGDVIQLVT
jgi:hypothetical protein